MAEMGNCTRCGARTASASGPRAGAERASYAAAVTSGGRVLGFVIESVNRWTKRDEKQLICINCTTAAVAGKQS